MMLRHVWPWLTGLGACVCGCAPPDPLAEALSTDRVIIVGTELLDPPPVRRTDVYRPANEADIDLARPERGRAVEFYLHLAAGRPEAVQIHIVDRSSKSKQSLRRLADLQSDAEPPFTDRDAVDALAADDGVFRRVGTVPAGHRFAVAIPLRVMPARAILEVYGSTAPDGTPLGGDRIELARSFYHIAVIGDSLMWGNGLHSREKFATLVAEEIERRTDRRVIRQVQAISAVGIVPIGDEIPCPLACNGEVQTASTSITNQVDLIEAPGQIDLCTEASISRASTVRESSLPKVRSSTARAFVTSRSASA
jgi:hypothetical protein